MNSDLDLPESEPGNSVAVDRTVTYLFAGLAVIMAFLVIMSTFLQVDRFTTKPKKTGPAAMSPAEPEIGG